MPAHIGGDIALLSAAEFAVHKERLSSDVEELVYASIQFFRKKILADGPLSRRILEEDGLLPEFTRLLEKHGSTRVRFEAAWCLTNVASGDSEMTRAVVDAGALPLFTALISLDRAMSDDEFTASLCEECIWAVGNICGDGAVMRDLVIDSGAPQKMAAILEQAAAITERPNGGVHLPVLRRVAWCSSNIFASVPMPAYTAPLADLLRALSGVVTVDDSEARVDVVLGISRACELDVKVASEFAEFADIEAIVGMARDADLDVNARMPALRIVGNLVSGAEDTTQAVVDADGVDAFFSIALERGVNDGLQKEALWALSNVAAGTKPQRMAVVLHHQMQDLCVRVPTLPADCLKEGLWVIANACQCEDAQVVDAVIAGGGMVALVKGLSLDDNRAKVVALEGLQHILSAPPLVPDARPKAEISTRAASLREIGGFAALFDCQLAMNLKVRDLALQIIKLHFVRVSKSVAINRFVDSRTPPVVFASQGALEEEEEEDAHIGDEEPENFVGGGDDDDSAAGRDAFEAIRLDD